MIRKIAATALLCSSLYGGAAAAPSFELETGVRLSSAVIHCVTPLPGGYRLYYSTGSFYSVLSASSTDGLAWTAEPGARLSPGSGAFNYDASSITSMGLYFNSALAGGPYHSFYVGVSTNGYALLSAKSADGLTWTKAASFAQTFSGARLRSPRAYHSGGNHVRLYYIRDSAGALAEEAFKVYGMASSDNGNSFSGEALLLPTTGAYSIEISTLTTGTMRMHVAVADLSGSTVARVLASDSANGTTFHSSPSVVFSTGGASNSLLGMAVARSTESFRWRLYFTSRLNQETTAYAHSALTLDPVITGFAPGLAYIDDPATNFTVTGEVFAPGLNTAAIAGTPGTLTVNTVTRVSDTEATVNATPTGAAIGLYGVSVTNPDGRSASLGGVLNLDYRPGFTVLTDNLFRPLRGGRVRVDTTIYYPGEIEANVYTLNGGLVRKLYKGPVAAGTLTFFWNGDTDNGRKAASGLYLIHITGPKLKDTEKVVLIK